VSAHPKDGPDALFPLPRLPHIYLNLLSPIRVLAASAPGRLE
jgi:hypothetical protein